MATRTPNNLPTCASVTHLPPLLAVAARYLAPVQEDDFPVERGLRCALGAHGEGEHQALVRELDGSDNSSAWVTWRGDRGRPGELVIRTRCQARGDRGGCGLYQRHPGDHAFSPARTAVTPK
jgi:hypothetical protein